MDRGFMLDHTHGALIVGMWAKGKPKWSFFFRTKRAEFTLPVAAFRCTSCGYLELYARSEFDAE
jgi:hypothetical protein